MSDKRVVPGGYICKSKITEIEMCHADIIRDLDAITAVNASREEIYRLIARVLNRTHQADKYLSEIKMILDN